MLRAVFGRVIRSIFGDGDVVVVGEAEKERMWVRMSVLPSARYRYSRGE